MTEFVVNTGVLSYRNMDPVVTQLPDNKFVIVWSRENMDIRGADIYAQLFLASGQKLGNEFIISPAHIGKDYYPDVAPLNGGGFVVSYMRYESLGKGFIGKARIFRSDCMPITNSDIMLHSGEEDSVYEVSVSGLSHGGFIATWDAVMNSSNAESYGVYGRIFHEDGTPAGEQFLVSQYDMQYEADVVTLTDGRFVICFVSNQGIVAQIYEPSGNKIVKDFIVNNNTESFSKDDSPTIATLSTGGFVIVWDSMMVKLYAKAYAADGISVGETIVYSIGSCCIKRQSVTSLPEGEFLVLWSESNITSRDSDVFGQKFTADAKKSGQVFIVNSATDGMQTDQSSTTLDNGNIVVTWMSQRAENCVDDLFFQCSADIFAQCYTQDLIPIVIDSGF